MVEILAQALLANLNGLQLGPGQSLDLNSQMHERAEELVAMRLRSSPAFQYYRFERQLLQVLEETVIEVFGVEGVTYREVLSDVEHVRVGHAEVNGSHSLV